MTANDSTEDRDACLRAGMDDYPGETDQAATVLAAVDPLVGHRTRQAAAIALDAAALPRLSPGDAMNDAIARLERELADARREAESATRARSAFLAAMSHELKTPMNAVFGSARLLLETTLTAQQHEHVATTLAAGEAMLTIVEDAIDYAALEGGALALAHAPFDLAALVDAAVQIDAGRAHEKGLDLAALIDPALPALVVGDAARVRLIVRKLLSNAITFTDTGSVLVRARSRRGRGASSSRTPASASG
jgi:signal transduction histidine kinase